MALDWSEADWHKVTGKIETFFEGFKADLQLAGESAAESIVRFTLAGIGEDDQPFKPYSAAYLAILEAVGGKVRNVVDLRGLFYHKGQKRARFRSEARRQRFREGRQGFIRAGFFARGDNPVGFTARTGITRPAKGVTDPLSEMSLDLIKVEATDTTLKLRYTPRKNEYMIFHQRGEGRNPMRKWFTLNRRGTIAGLMAVLKAAIAARARRFNDQSGGP